MTLRFKSFLKTLIISTLLSVAIVHLLLPITANSKYFINFIKNFSVNIEKGLFSVFFLITFLYFKKIVIFWKKYLHTNRFFKNINGLFFYEKFIIFFLCFFDITVLPSHNYIFKEFIFLIIGSLIIYFSFTLLVAYFLNEGEKYVLQDSANELNDVAIRDWKYDLFDRRKFIDALYRDIVHFDVSDNSFVCGLYGQWGEGKTSLLNLLELKFQENTKGEFLIFRFDPWYFNNTETMVSAFYNDLEKIIIKKYIIPGFDDDFKRFSRALSAGVSSLGTKFELCGLKVDVVGASKGGRSIDELKRNIEKSIRSIHEKIIVIIDDIDRLEKKEILSVFKTVRLSSDFSRVVFVLAFDNVVVSEKIKTTHNELNQGDYISKIVQKPVCLPKVEQFEIDRFLFISDHPIPSDNIEVLLRRNEKKRIFVRTFGRVCDIHRAGLFITDRRELGVVRVEFNDDVRVDNLFDCKVGDYIYLEGFYDNEQRIIIQDIDGVKHFYLSQVDKFLFELILGKKLSLRDVNLFKNNFMNFYITRANGLVKTLRDAKRYVNGLRSSFASIANEVDIEDFFLLEFIKIFQKDLYDDIYDNWYFYVDDRGRNDFNPLIGLSKSMKNQRILGHINSFFDSRYAPAKKEILFEILKRMFPNVQEACNEQR